MPVTCIVVNCYNRAGRDEKRFFRIPAIITNQGSRTKKLTEIRRKNWFAAIRREGLDDKQLQYMRVCNDHFLSGEPSKLYDSNNPDWVPTLNMGYQRADSFSPSRYSRCQTRDVKRNTSLLHKPDISNGSKSKTDQLDVCRQENESLRMELSAAKKMKQTAFINTPDHFKGDNDKIRYYTGLSSFVSLMALFKLLETDIIQYSNSSLTKFEKVLITLMRLRLSMPITDLGYRFSVCTSTISKSFYEILNIMFVQLQPLLHWPRKDELMRTMPMCFRRSFDKKIAAIIDCFEIFVDRPSSLMARAQTWSNYKHHNTAKYLIAITPQGSVSFISEGWGGRVSDKHLVSQCGFLDHLQQGDIVLADRGFDITELIATFGAEVYFPAFTRGKKQLSAREVESTRKIANVRIHVERVIGSLRQKYTILGSTIPIDYLMTSAEDSQPLLDKIVFVCCALTNMCPSVVPFN